FGNRRRAPAQLEGFADRAGRAALLEWPYVRRRDSSSSDARRLAGDAARPALPRERAARDAAGARARVRRATAADRLLGRAGRLSALCPHAAQGARRLARGLRARSRLRSGPARDRVRLRRRGDPAAYARAHSVAARAAARGGPRPARGRSADRAQLRADRAVGPPALAVAGRLSRRAAAHDSRGQAQGLARASELRGRHRAPVLPYFAARAVPARRNVPERGVGAAVAADAVRRLSASRAEARASADADPAGLASAASQGRRRSRAVDARLAARRARAQEARARVKEVEAFTDGACRGNPGPGGWGVLLRHRGRVKELCGGDPQTTNNRMEMTAAIRALEALKEPCRVHLYTDS